MAEETAAPTTEQPETSLSSLARGMFGDNYRGEVKETVTPTDQPSGDGEEPAADTSGEESEEQEEEQTASAEEGEEQEGEEASGEESDEGQDSEEVPISSVDELIQHYELDPEWFESLELPVKVDGQSQTVKMGDLKKSFQMTEAAEKRLNEAKERSQAQNRELAQKQEELQTHFATAAKLIERAEERLESDAKGINWADLRQNDPAEYSAKKAEVAERRQEIDQLKRDAVQDFQRTTQQSQEQMKQQHQELMQQEQKKLIEAIPEWADFEKSGTERKQVARYLMGQGLTEEQIGNAADHRLFVMARKAMLFDNQQGKTNTAQKKVAKVPKTLKSGKPKPQEQINKERTDKQRQKLRKSGSIDDAFALLQARRGK